VTGLYRYPVKSMQGLDVATLDLTADGFVGDRRWALLDAATGRLMSAKRWSALLQASADDDGLTLPDGTWIPFAAPDADALLSVWLGREVRLVTLRHAAERRGDLDWDVRRFRPNVVVDGDLEAFAEDEWVGRTLRVGGAELAVRQPTVRCAMPLRAQPGLARQASMYAALEELHRNHLGLYLDAVTPGRIAVGDEVIFVD
jgi:uncharacterized protein YcbX